MAGSFLVALSAALMSVIVTAGSNSTTLSNGAQLTVSVTSPVTGTEFNVPPGQPSINVAIDGSASIGVGDPAATFIYVMDNSGSTGGGSGTGCAPLLNCEKQFFVALNNAVVADGSTLEVGFITFETGSVIHDMQVAAGQQNFTSPADPNVTTVINAVGTGGATNCGAGLSNALTLVNQATGSVKNVVFASDGLCNTGPSVASVAASLAAAGATVNSIAVGSGSDCTTDGGTGTLNQAAVGGGQCFQVTDPGALPDLIDNLIGSTLQPLDLSVDGGAPQAITNTSLPLPQAGAVSVDYSIDANNLGPGDHTLCVTAHGSDVTGGTAQVTQCETIHLLQLSAAPATATNELGSDNQHTVTATIAGGPASPVDNRLVSFAVSGQNAGATGVCSLNAGCTTDASGNVSFTYSVPIAPASLGTDSILVQTTIAGELVGVTVEKRWVDTTPPVPACVETVNPDGKNIPPAQNQNPDGFYQLGATDAVDPNPAIFVQDAGSGVVFGPFVNGTNIKYTQAPGVTPSSGPIGGPGSAVLVLIRGTGDALVYAIDGSGNQSAPVSCLVPPPPK